MNASISAACYKSKTLSNGENPLMIQISKNGRRKYQSLGVSIKPKYWDFTKNKPKPNCPDDAYIQKIVLDKVTEFQKQILEFNANQKDYTLTNLLGGNNNATDKIGLLPEWFTGNWCVYYVWTYIGGGEMGKTKGFWVTEVKNEVIIISPLDNLPQRNLNMKSIEKNNK